MTDQIGREPSCDQAVFRHDERTGFQVDLLRFDPVECVPDFAVHLCDRQYIQIGGHLPSEKKMVYVMRISCQCQVVVMMRPMGHKESELPTGSSRDRE